MIQYRYATIDEIDYLVELRVSDLAMFSQVPLLQEGKENIYHFYKKKIAEDMCYTILGFDTNSLVATGTIYFYETLPSNANPTGITGCITNIWTHEAYRKQGIASTIMQELMKLSQGRCGLLCLNASEEGRSLYEKLGFEGNEAAMLYRM